MELYKAQLNELMSVMVQLTNELALKMNKAVFFDCQMYHIPLISREEEGKLSVKESLYRDIESIAVTPYVGEEAALLFREAISARAFYAQDGQSTKIVPKFPGFISIPHDEELIQLCNELNTAKREFGVILAARAKLTNKREHFEWVHSIFPMLISLVAKRELKYFSQPLRSLNFHWKRDTNNTVFTKSELIQLLEDNLKVHLSKSVDPDLTQTQFVSDIDSIRRSTYARFRMRRKKPVAPAISVYFKDGTRSFCSVSSPIILFGQDDVKVSALESYQRNEVKARKLNSFKSGPLILEKLNIFGVEEHAK
ncbi:hypothetical protein PULV_a3944 [Pseudoalteromonas ulvae UL12]|uniref:DNA replication terminus site-binding protein n=1 Tax=Pseudoalteromonas ulvae TaxID=107327 RepID=UPI00186BB1A6|nr:DNA replication terminus site-binding protein [Pseudoalteromonas ulvae]MBE0362140.1 hypothetical protein [Pseudoalteromonas ulvae UL12]